MSGLGSDCSPEYVWIIINIIIIQSLLLSHHPHYHHRHHRHYHRHIINITVHISITNKQLTGLKYWLVGYWFAGLIVLPCISLTPDDLSLKYLDIFSLLMI